MRAGFGGAYALDYGAVLAMARALQAPEWLVAEMLPEAEIALLAGLAAARDAMEID